MADASWYWSKIGTHFSEVGFFMSFCDASKVTNLRAVV